MLVVYSPTDQYIAKLKLRGTAISAGTNHVQIAKALGIDMLLNALAKAVVRATTMNKTAGTSHMSRVWFSLALSIYS